MEELVNLVGRDADPSVVDIKLNQICVFRMARNVDINMSTGCELDRISHEIHQNLTDASGISFADDRHVRFHMIHGIQFFLVCLR
ncbi:MAG: hypothetical protein BWY82_01614 [Verrucomicrobia bacterium ADurb.Bin474]|nr:MAG: hypothetical protein BWY82_01614 [Verrucomicrobia bacterium ADurb.Bin474]